MGKISPVSAKYIVHSQISVDGVVDKPDVIGAIFGQTEGLLGEDLELRELQRSGKIGRIEVNLDTKGGKTNGYIIIPSSLDKAETAIVGAALEIIQRIGPCNAKLKVERIEDVRISKRQFVIERAKELLKTLTDSVLPDSQEIADEVSSSVRIMEITEYGRERLAAGPTIDEGDEVIVVEGRADVLNLLKNGFKNCIAINGTNIPQTIIDLAQKKTVTAFVDGDRGGDLILTELLTVAEVDYVTKAPDGKEVEELTKKEIHKALRSRIAAEQIKLELGVKEIGGEHKAEDIQRVEIKVDKQVEKSTFDSKKSQPQQQRDMRANERRQQPQQQPQRMQQRPELVQQQKKIEITSKELEKFGSMLEDLIGTRGAYLIDEQINILGKVPVTELQSTLKSLTKGVLAVILDGVIDKELLAVAERSNISYLVAMDSNVKSTPRITILTADDV
ncbi:MAG: DNA primase DnaG [Candidatus Woesearchaeota archaeon]